MEYRQQLKEAYTAGFMQAKVNTHFDVLFSFKKWYPIHCRKLELKEQLEKKLRRTK